MNLFNKSIITFGVVLFFLFGVQIVFSLDDDEMNIIAKDLQKQIGVEWVVLPMRDGISIRQNGNKSDQNDFVVTLKFSKMSTDSYLKLANEKFSLWLKLFKGSPSKEVHQEIVDKYDGIDLPEYDYFGYFVDLKVQVSGSLEEQGAAKGALLSKLDAFFQVLPRFDDWVGR